MIPGVLNQFCENSLSYGFGIVGGEAETLNGTEKLTGNVRWLGG